MAKRVTRTRRGSSDLADRLPLDCKRTGRRCVVNGVVGEVVECQAADGSTYSMCFVPKMKQKRTPALKSDCGCDDASMSLHECWPTGVPCASDGKKGTYWICMSGDKPPYLVCMLPKTTRRARLKNATTSMASNKSRRARKAPR